MSWLNSFKKPVSTTSEIDNLAYAIIKASRDCGKEFKGLVNKRFGEGSKDAVAKLIIVQYESLFFFIHLTMRFAFSKLGNDRRNKLQSLLVPILADTITEIYFSHLPQDMKEKAKNNFIHDMNAAELEYSKYKKIFPTREKGTVGTLFWEFSKNIVKLSEYYPDPLIIIRCTRISIEKFKEMKLDKLIDSVSKEI